MRGHINETISEYLNSDVAKYPWHMPGHKRKPVPWACTDERDEQTSQKSDDEQGDVVGRAFSRDLTEVPGLDDMHHPTGMIRQSLEEAAKVYGAYKTYYLVNGATCGNLAALFAYVNDDASAEKINDSAERIYDGNERTYGSTERIYDRGMAEQRGSVKREKTLIVARNCHKSVFNAVKLLGVKPIYVYPKASNEVSIDGEINAESIREVIEKNPGKDIRCCIITSPTYEGVISDIKAISECLHEYGIPLIVDEAHGAHFPFYRTFDKNDIENNAAIDGMINMTADNSLSDGESSGTGQMGADHKYPCSSLHLGADVVIQSLHKTLPCYTQTAVLHVANKTQVDLGDVRGRTSENTAQRIEEYLSIFQTSSPSYVFMQAMEKCIAWCDENRTEFVKHFERIVNFRISFEQAGMKNLRLFSYNVDSTTRRESAEYSAAEKNAYQIAEKKINQAVKNNSQDLTRLVFMIKGITGNRAAELLEEKKGLVFEMAGIDYLVAISTVMDEEKDLQELLSGLEWLDEMISCGPEAAGDNYKTENNDQKDNNGPVTMKDVFIMTDSGECSLKEAIGRRITDYIYVYPPGIPIIAPFEKIEDRHVSEILHDICAGYEMRGNVRVNNDRK
ncbi:MAG: hypothetical protein IJJ74_08795 [Eubacterium sp.]|nr:hypothetical protein [Eubacterium sp.]